MTRSTNLRHSIDPQRQPATWTTGLTPLSAVQSTTLTPENPKAPRLPSFVAAIETAAAEPRARKAGTLPNKQTIAIKPSDETVCANYCGQRRSARFEKNKNPAFIFFPRKN